MKYLHTRNMRHHRIYTHESVDLVAKNKTQRYDIIYLFALDWPDKRQNAALRCKAKKKEKKSFTKRFRWWTQIIRGFTSRNVCRRHRRWLGNVYPPQMEAIAWESIEKCPKSRCQWFPVPRRKCLLTNNGCVRFVSNYLLWWYGGGSGIAQVLYSSRFIVLLVNVHAVRLNAHEYVVRRLALIRSLFRIFMDIQ